MPPCEDVRSRRRRWCRSSEPRWDHSAGHLYQILLDIISSYCVTRIANLVRFAQMIASLPHYHHAAASFWAAHIFPVLLHTHILSGRQSSTQSGKSLQISVDLDHFPENGLLLPTHTLSRRQISATFRQIHFPVKLLARQAHHARWRAQK